MELSKPHEFRLDNRHDNPYFNMQFHAKKNKQNSYDFIVENRPITHLIFNDSLSGNQLNICAKKAPELYLEGVFLKGITSARIVLDLWDNCHAHIFICEIAQDAVDLDLEINLKSPGVILDLSLASIALDQSPRQYQISINHQASDTTSQINLKGVIKNSGIITFLPRAIINKNCENCQAKQDNRIVNLSEKTRGIIKPVLKIENNEVVASHNAAIGTIKDDDIFYLLSRGLPPSQARHLVIDGYIKPIYKQLSETEDKKKFDIVFQRGIKYA